MYFGHICLQLENIHSLKCESSGTSFEAFEDTKDCEQNTFKIQSKMSKMPYVHFTMTKIVELVGVIFLDPEPIDFWLAKQSEKLGQYIR